jgi:TRAP-type C4-dicarboxylate transport system permease small subunit
VSKILYWGPIAVVAYALWGMFFDQHGEAGGLPRSFWYMVGGVTAALLLIFNILERLDGKR